MVEIEEALHKLHAREKAKREQDESEAQVEAMDLQASPPSAFARVDAVTQGSPACGAVSGAKIQCLLQDIYMKFIDVFLNDAFLSV